MSSFLLRLRELVTSRLNAVTSPSRLFTPLVDEESDQNTAQGNQNVQDGDCHEQHVDQVSG